MAEITRRSRHLLRARAALTGGPSLRPVLRHIVTAARELVGARYAALSMIDEDGRVDEFVHDGVDEHTTELIGTLPNGHGLLGQFLHRATPLRLDDLAGHPATAGFPLHHPAMASFLGVPIQIRGRTRGLLYLADIARGRFSAADEDLALTFVTGAAVAIENIELRRLSWQRERWLATSAAVTRQVLGGGGGDPFDPLLQSAQVAAEADFGSLALVTGLDRLQIRATSGVLADDLPGRLLDLDTSLAGQVIRSARPVRTHGYPDTGDTPPQVPIGSVVVVPVVSGDVVTGALAVGRLAHRRPYTEMDIAYLAEFAGCLGMATELSKARTETRLHDDPAEGDPIGAELDEHVVQRLFAVSLGLENLMTISGRQVVRDRLTEYIGSLDESIDRIRSVVYGIDSTLGRDRPRSLQHRVLAAVEDCTPALGMSVTTTFSGELGSNVPAAMADTVVDTVRQILRAIAEHAHATRVELGLSIGAGLLTIDIVDNGTETQAPERIDVFSSLRERAEAHAGSLDMNTPAGGGTRMIWTARTP